MRKQAVWKKKKVRMMENEKMKPMRVKSKKMEMGNNKQ
jgi:hypothetical protein